MLRLVAARGTSPRRRLFAVLSLSGRSTMSSTSHGDARPDQAEIDAKRAARAAKKAAKRNEQDDGTPEASTSSRSFLKRDLVSAASEAQIAQWSGRRRLKLMTWNVRAVVFSVVCGLH